MLADVLLLLFGGATAALSLALPIGTFRAPGSGLYPLALGLLLIGLAVGHVVQRRRAAATGAAPVPQQTTDSGARVCLFLAAIATATALLGVLGFPLVAFLVMLAMLEILGVRRRRDSVLIALCTAVAAYALFVQWLKIPLPKGWIGL
jgi:hypothetical protein